MCKSKFKFMVLVAIIALGFINCDGRRNTQQALSESISEFKKRVNIEIDVFIPEGYTAHEVDSVLDNGFDVSIKTYTDMEHSTTQTRIKDTINYQTHYRNYIYNILIKKSGRDIYKEQFTKEKANRVLGYTSDLVSESELHDFDKLAVLKRVAVNSEKSSKHSVAIDIMYAIPETERYALHRLFVTEDGKSNIIKVEVN